MNFNFILIAIFLIMGCSGKIDQHSDAKLWSLANESRELGDLRSAITNFRKIITNFPNSELSDKAQFQIADIFLNDIKDYQFSINEFMKLIEMSPESALSKKALFMIAYIYGNYLDSYSVAILKYNQFLDKYPNDELVPSVKFELDNLMNYQGTIDSLNTI